MNTVAIDPKGDIYPCTYVVHQKKYKMGNIENFEELVENEEFKSYKGSCYARTLLPVSEEINR